MASSEENSTSLVSSRLLWESILCFFPGMPIVKELFKIVPAPDDFRVKRLILLRCLEHHLVNHGIDSHVYNQLNLLKKLSYELGAEDEVQKDSEVELAVQSTPPSDLLLLAVVRELTVAHMRNDDWPSFDESVKEYWIGRKDAHLSKEGNFEGVLEDGQVEAELGATIIRPFRQAKRDILSVFTDFTLRIKISRKYPEEAVWAMLEEFLSKAWEEEKNGFILQNCQMAFLKKGLREAFLEKKRKPFAGEEITSDAKKLPEKPIIAPCSTEKLKEIEVQSGPLGEESPVETTKKELRASKAQVWKKEVVKRKRGRPKKEDSNELPKTPGTLAELKLLSENFQGTKRKLEESEKVDKKMEDEEEKISPGKEIQEEEEEEEDEIEEEDKILEKEEGKNLEGEIPNFNVSSEKNNAGKFRDFVILEHLRNASADLRRKGRDPLPEAISLAKKVAEEEVKKSTTGEDQNKQTEVESEESGPKSVENEGEQKEENDNLVKPTPIRLQAAKSLLERQSNAQQLKWDSEAETEPANSQEKASQKGAKVPRLDKGFATKEIRPLRAEIGVVAKEKTPRYPNLVPKRRTNIPWKEEEIVALIEGLKKYGTKWKLIFLENAALFSGRTSVDLKDKWRNMEKYGHKLLGSK